MKTVMKKMFCLLLVAVMLVGSVEALAGTDKMPTNLTNIEDEAFYENPQNDPSKTNFHFLCFIMKSRNMA